MEEQRPRPLRGGLWPAAPLFRDGRGSSERWALPGCEEDQLALLLLLLSTSPVGRTSQEAT